MTDSLGREEQIGFNIDLTRTVVSCNESKVRREWKRKFIRSTDDRSALDPETNYTATEQRRSKVRIDCRLLFQLGASKRLYACYFWHLRSKE